MLPTLPGAVVDFGARSLRRFVEVESIQSWLLAAAFVVVIGAVVGALTSEHYSARSATASISTS